MMIATRIVLALCVVPATAGAVAAPIATFLPNTISVEPLPGGGPTPPADPIFAEAMEEALAARGFTTLPQPGHSRLVAQLRVTRMAVGTTTAKVPVAGLSTAAGGARGVGASLALNLPTGKTQTVPLLRTRLDLRISRQGESAAVWQGSAVTVGAADLREKQESLLAAKLAGAVLTARGEDADGPVAVP